MAAGAWTFTDAARTNLLNGTVPVASGTFKCALLAAGADVEVVPGPLALTLVTFAPSVSVTDNQEVIPGPLALSLSGFAPIVTATANVLVTPGCSALVLATHAPVVTASGDGLAQREDPEHRHLGRGHVRQIPLRARRVSRAPRRWSF